MLSGAGSLLSTGTTNLGKELSIKSTQYRASLVLGSWEYSTVRKLSDTEALPSHEDTGLSLTSIISATGNLW